LTSAEVAERLGVHKNTVRFHLDSLIDSGQVEQVESPRSKPGRPAQVFRAVRRMDPTGPRHYELLAGVLTEALLAESDAVTRAVAAGQSWGRRAASAITEAEETAAPTTSSSDPVTRTRNLLIQLLERFGFAPEHAEDPDGNAEHTEPAVERPTSARPVAVRHCPFLELAAEHQRIVCGVHLGLMRGALTHWQTPIDPEEVGPTPLLVADKLVPFAEPDRCLVQLRLSG
jgi:predicted ArsR family transcriptional regulator